MVHAAKMRSEPESTGRFTRARRPCGMLITLLFVSAFALPTNAQKARGENALSGGFGLQSGLSTWAPGGFKWFNDYSRELSKLVWLNFQLNTVMGDIDGDCWHDASGQLHCDYNRWDGNTVELVIGVKLQWDLDKIPLVIDAKLGGAFDLLLLGADYVGVAMGFRGGISARYFFFHNFGVGAEIIATLGPSFISDGQGAELYAAIDWQIIGVEYRW